MIDAKQAVTNARAFFDQVYHGGPLREVLLEEVQLSGESWMITFGFDWQPESGTSSIGPGDRKYKMLELDAADGRVLSMKIVNVNA